MTHSSFVFLIWYVHSFSHCFPYMVCPFSEHIASSARQRKKIGRSLEDLKEMLEKLFKQLADIVAAITKCVTRHWCRVTPTDISISHTL